MLETGILGSLRWWMEAIARGHGIAVPDPVVDAPRYQAKRPEALDPVSRIFGATDWRRVFRLTIHNARQERIPGKITISAAPHRSPRRDITHDVDYSTWYYAKQANFTHAWGGEFEIHVQQIAAWTDYNGASLQLFSDLLRAVSKLGSIGAKPQLGLGFFEFAKEPIFTGDAGEGLAEWLKKFGSTTANPAIDPELPNLRDFQIGSRAVTQQLLRPLNDPWQLAFVTRSELKNKFRSPNGKMIGSKFRHALTGEIGENPVRCKVAISHPFTLAGRSEQEQRLFCWLPASLGTHYSDLLQNRVPIHANFRTEIETFFAQEYFSVENGVDALQRVL
jgi:CRISPR-associated protein Cmr1